MLRLRIVILFLILCIIGLSFSACSPIEPILNSDIAEKVKDNFGYALAPTWMPEGFEYDGPFLDNLVSENRVFTGQNIT